MDHCRLLWIFFAGLAQHLPTRTLAQPAPTAAQAAFNNPTVQSLIDTNDASGGGIGKARLEILKGSNNVQVSNFGGGSFQLINTGDKRIAAAFIDVTESIFKDVVFDDDGSGGDNVAKDLNYDNGENEVGAVSINDYSEFWLPARKGSFNGQANFNPNNLNDVNNLFVDATADNNNNSPKAGGGYRGELLLFTDFDPDESVGFSGDMDPNSIAGLFKGTVDDGANWDVGGVSGSEMVHGEVTVLFGDGSTITSRLAGDGSQSGSVAIIESGLLSAPELTVNGVGPGGTGNYNSNDPTVIVSADAGAKVRVSLVAGFDPVVTDKLVGNDQITVRELVEARLQAQYPEFPVSNSRNWQHDEATIPSSGQLDVSAMFSYESNNDPIALTAVVIDGNGDPVSMTTKPIYLLFGNTNPPPPPPPSTPPPPPATSAPVAVPPPVAGPPPASCSASSFTGECGTTNQCKSIYTGAFDCKNSAGGVCFCDNDVVCGCRDQGTPPVASPTNSPVAPVPSPDGSCSQQNFQAECKTTGFCKSIYATAEDCKNSKGGVCYCAGDKVCGCL